MNYKHIVITATIILMLAGTASALSISSPSPGITDTKYVSNQSITYSATISESANCGWYWQNGTLIEWDNSTASPSTKIWINSSSTDSINIVLTAYNPSNPSDSDSVSWNNPVTDDLFVDANYTWSRWGLFPGEGFVGVVGNIPVGDVDNDGFDEIVCVGSRLGDSVQNKDILIYERDGSYKHYTNITSSSYRHQASSIHDIDSDGTNELLCFLANIGGNTAPGAGADLFRFNTTNVTNSKLTTLTTTASSNFNKNPAWMTIDGEEHFYTTHCGDGDTVNNFINFTTDTKTGIDDYAGNSGEDNIAWDIDGDGDDELIVVEGWNTNAAKIWMYEIDPTTGNYTSKTMLFDNDLTGGQHWSAAIMTGDIDNDGIDNLIIFWAPVYTPFHLGRIEAYEFDGITEFGEGNYSEGFTIASVTGTDYTSIGGSMEGHGKAVIGDVDNDGNNELITGFYMYEQWDAETRHIVQFDVATNGASVQKTYLANFTSDYMGGATYERHSATPAIFSYGGKNHLFIAVEKQEYKSDALETEFFVLSSAESSGGGGAYNITLPLGWSIIGWTSATPTTAHSMGGMIGDNCTYVVERNATTGEYIQHNMAGPEDEDNFAINRGWGYFVKIIAETIWERDS